ncbi:MAG: APC family permease [Gammaproteobacteria bacterium]|jgi:amino acid transporter|nr:APC family permease [Gammaproteobacteria bacterium]
MEEASKPPRVVGKLGATLMSVNGMIGAGIFALPAILYAEVGNFAPWMFLIFGTLYATGILISARLSNMFRSSGGPQLWAQVAFGPFVGFQVGWIMVLAMAAGRAATLYVLVSYLAVIFPVFLDSVWRVTALAFLLLAMTWLTIWGMKKSVGGLAIGTVLKVTPILVLCLLAFASGGIATEFTLPRFGAFESVALLVYFAYSGANSSAYSAGELKNPRRDLPITMLTSLAVIIMFYMAVQWAYIAAGAPQSVGDTTPLSAAAGSVMGDGGALLLSLAAIFSIATNCLSFYIAGPRVAYAMADRGLLPETFAHVSRRFKTPDRAILLFSTIVAVMLASGAFVFLATVTSLGGQCVTLVYILAFVLLMRRSHGGHDGRLALYWWPVILVAAFFAIFSIAQAPAKAFLLLAALLVVGTVLYFLERRSEISAPEPILD